MTEQQEQAAMAEDGLVPAEQAVQAPVETPPVSAEEEAAMKFTRLLPFISKLANALPSKGGAIRVITAMAEFPLGGRHPRLLNDAERQLFSILQELNGYKSTVVQGFMKQQMEMDQATKNAAQAAAESETNGRSEEI